MGNPPTRWDRPGIAGCVEDVDEGLGDPLGAVGAESDDSARRPGKSGAADECSSGGRSRTSTRSPTSGGSDGASRRRGDQEDRHHNGAGGGRSAGEV